MLLAWRGGQEKALDQILPLVEGELRKLAHAYMRRENRDHLLQTTALLNEAYLRLVDAAQVNWENRAHFYGICARLMRQILMEYARSEHAQKRGAGEKPLNLEEAYMMVEEIKEECDTGDLETAGDAKARASRRILWAIGVAAVLVVATVWVWLIRPRGGVPEAQPLAVPLTSYPGNEYMPSFSPDGSQVAFMWDGEKHDNFDIYVKLIGSDPPLRLTRNPAREFSPAWSPDNRRIAFCRDLPGRKFAVVLTSPIGGPERILTEVNYPTTPIDSPYLAWTPNAQWLAIVGVDRPAERMAIFLYSIQTGEKRRLTFPPANYLGDSCPAFSGDARVLAFSRWVSWASRDLYLINLTSDLKPIGEPKRLTSENWMAGSSAWSVGGRSLILSAGSGEHFDLWRVDVFGLSQPQRLAVGTDGECPAISQQRNRLAYSHAIYNINIYRIELPSPQGKANPAQKLIASTRKEYLAEFSPDGTKISFISDRSGNEEIWVCDFDGGNAVPLTFLGGPTISSPARWSPDGRRLTFSSNIEGHEEVYVVNANGGSPQRLTSSTYSANPSWSRDGRWIYFDTTTGEIRRVPADGGSPVFVTDKGGWGPIESPDGKLIYSSAADKDALLETPVGGGETRQVLDSLLSGFRFAVVRDGIYFIPRRDPVSGYSIEFLNTATGTIQKIAFIEKPPSTGLSVSPDRRWILYSQIDQSGSDLMLVENFR